MLTLSNGADSLAVTERFPHPMNRASVLSKRLRALASARNDERVEQRAALALEVVVRPHAALAGANLNAFGIHPAAAGADDPGGSTTSLDGCPEALDLCEVETVRDKDSDAARLDRRLLRRIVQLRERRRRLAMVLTRRLFRNDAADVDCDLLREIEVDVVEQLAVRLVDDGIIAVRKLERDRVREVLLLVVSERVVEQLRLAKVLLELRTAHAGLHSSNLLRMSRSTS